MIDQIFILNRNPILERKIVLCSKLIGNYRTLSHQISAALSCFRFRSKPTQSIRKTAATLQLVYMKDV